MLVRYIGTDERVYPKARRDGAVKPLVVGPGDVVDLDEVPEDGCWQPEVKPAPKSAPVAAKAAGE
jgi:hypothetical protein